MANETNSDKGFWVQIVLGLAIIILIFMYIRSMSGKHPTQAAAKASSTKTQAAKATPPKDPAALLAEAAAKQAPSQPAAAPQVAAEEVVAVIATDTSASPAPVEEQSVVAVIAEAPQVVEAAPSGAGSPTPVIEQTAVAAEQPAPPATEAKVKAAAAEPQETAKTATSPESKPSEQAAGDTKASKGSDWLSKLGFGKDGQPAAASKDDALSSTDKSGPASVQAVATKTEGKAAAAESKTVAKVQAGAGQPAAATARPQMPNPYEAMAQRPAEEVPAWAKERMERVEQLRTELHDSMVKMREAGAAKIAEERQRRYEQRLQSMPEWMRPHIEKVHQLRKALQDEMSALHKAVREHRAEAMAGQPALIEGTDAEAGPDVGPHAAMQPGDLVEQPEPPAAAPYYPYEMPYYGPQGGYAYPRYPFRY